MFSSESFKAAYDRYCEVRRAIIEAEEKARKEFIDAMIAASEQLNYDTEPAEEEPAEEEPAEEIFPYADDFKTCKPSVPGHRIPWYTTGFE